MACPDSKSIFSDNFLVKVHKSTMKTFIQTQQFGIRQILSLGGKIFSSNFRKILAVILCVHLPENIRTILPVDAAIENLGLEPNVVALAFGSIWLIRSRPFLRESPSSAFSLRGFGDWDQVFEP